jgi:hypothetical protein
VSVKFYVSATVFYSGWVKIEHGFKEISNPVTDFGDNANWDIFHKHTNVGALMIVVAVTTTAPATQIGQDSGGGE